MQLKISKNAFKWASLLIGSSVFNRFLEKNIDRCAFISSWLKKHGIPHTVVNIAGKRHIIVRYSNAAYESGIKVKTLAAHYDREKNTQGANDNSAACFQLMLFAKRLLAEKRAHNIKIIFTDGEEAGSYGIAEQGAFTLGVGLKKLKMDRDDIFVFDMCGAGDTLILSRSGIAGRDKARTKELDALHKRACTYAERFCPRRWLSMLTPYSDNAGFIAAGLSAQVVTVLPYDEALMLIHNLPNLENGSFLNGLSAKLKKNEELTAAEDLADHIIKNKKCAKNSPLQNIIPKTWQYMHTSEDCAGNLTPEAFIITARYLHALIYVRTPENKA